MVYVGWWAVAAESEEDPVVVLVVVVFCECPPRRVSKACTHLSEANV